MSLRSPFDELLGTEWLDDDPDHARVRVSVREELQQPAGLLHGGVISSLVESVCSRSTFMAVRDQGMQAMGQAVSVSFLRPIVEGVGGGGGAGAPSRPHDLGLGGRGARRRGAALRAGADDRRRPRAQSAERPATPYTGWSGTFGGLQAAQPA